MNLRNRIVYGDIKIYHSNAKEVVQVYGVCIDTLHFLVISIMIIGMTQFCRATKEPCQTANFGIICSKLCLCEGPILQEICIQGGKESTQLSRPPLLSLLLCDNAVKARSTFKPLKL